MVERAEKPPSNREASDCATAWFAVLERAREDNDFERAAEAVRQLRRLGVAVKFEHRKAKAVHHD